MTYAAALWFGWVEYFRDSSGTAYRCQHGKTAPYGQHAICNNGRTALQNFASDAVVLKWLPTLTGIASRRAITTPHIGYPSMKS